MDRDTAATIAEAVILRRRPLEAQERDALALSVVPAAADLLARIPQPDDYLIVSESDRFRRVRASDDRDPHVLILAGSHLFGVGLQAHDHRPEFRVWSRSLLGAHVTLEQTTEHGHGGAPRSVRTWTFHSPDGEAASVVGHLDPDDPGSADEAERFAQRVAVECGWTA